MTNGSLRVRLTALWSTHCRETAKQLLLPDVNWSVLRCRHHRNRMSFEGISTKGGTCGGKLRLPSTTPASLRCGCLPQGEKYQSAWQMSRVRDEDRPGDNRFQASGREEGIFCRDFASAGVREENFDTRARKTSYCLNAIAPGMTPAGNCL
jgi:hypothetical protein